jgi:hypothetical protein
MSSDNVEMNMALIHRMHLILPARRGACITSDGTVNGFFEFEVQGSTSRPHYVSGASASRGRVTSEPTSNDDIAHRLAVRGKPGVAGMETL